MKASLIASSQPIFSRRSMYCEIVSDESGEMGPCHDRLRATLREDGPDLPRITNQGWRRGRWGSFGRCIAGTGFAHGGVVTGTWILPRSLMMPESARRGREGRPRRCHAVCR